MQQPMAPQNNAPTQPYLYPKRTMSPYGVRFEDQNQYRRQQQMQYKEDLDYLNSVKPKSTDNSLYQNDPKKIQFMNDRYNYEVLSHRQLEKDIDEYNLQVALQKRLAKENERKASYKDYLKLANSYQSQIDLQKRIEREKKEKVRQELEVDLQNYYRRKDQEKLNKIRDGNKFKELFEQQDRRMSNSIDQYRNKILSMNNRIYNNALKYNDFVNGGANDDAFRAKNDFDYNRRVAELREKEKRDKILLYPQYKAEREKEKLKDKEYNEMIQNEKLSKQRKYRTELDEQNAQRKIRKENERKTLTESGEMLMMPGYKYPNLPQPLLKRAYDPIYNHSMTPSYPMNEKNFYLGDTSLRRNPITCPVDDVGFNKNVINDINKFIKMGSNSNSFDRNYQSN